MLTVSCCRARLSTSFFYREYSVAALARGKAPGFGDGLGHLFGILHVAAGGFGVIFRAAVGGDPNHADDGAVGIRSTTDGADSVAELMPGGQTALVAADGAGFRFGAGGVLPAVSRCGALSGTADGADFRLGAGGGEKFMDVRCRPLDCGFCCVRFLNHGDLDGRFFKGSGRGRGVWEIGGSCGCCLLRRCGISGGQSAAGYKKAQEQKKEEKVQKLFHVQHHFLCCIGTYSSGIW